ncbi:MAG: hypothetical protein J6O56_02285 [Bacilli bacterium]|nr:hypothetical protein [Bacilli bacterium]
MNNYNYLIKKHDLEVSKVTKKGNITIITTPLGQFVFKNENIKIYNYLLSRGFDYFPKIIDYNEDTIMFKYINNIQYPFEQKAEDYIKLLSLLHLKTNYFVKTNENEIKKTYEEVHNKIEEVNNYYNNLINIIESKEYMSPCEYLIARNISNIFMLLNYAFIELDKWYDLVKSNIKKRVCTLYNCIDINNLIKSTDGIYLTDFSKCIVDIPIYDLYNFFNRYYLDIDFVSLINRYEKIYKLSNDEKNLLYILISVPDKIKIDNKVDEIFKIKKQINKIFIVINILNSKKEKDTSTHQEEDNKN